MIQNKILGENYYNELCRKEEKLKEGEKKREKYDSIFKYNIQYV